MKVVPQLAHLGVRGDREQRFNAMSTEKDWSGELEKHKRRDYNKGGDDADAGPSTPSGTDDPDQSDHDVASPKSVNSTTPNQTGGRFALTPHSGHMDFTAKFDSLKKKLEAIEKSNAALSNPYVFLLPAE